MIKKIIRYCNDSKKYKLIDVELLEILNGFSKIATLTSNANRINNYSRSLYQAIETFQKDMRFGKFLIKHSMNQLCSTGFDIKKNGKKWELKFPKIEINLNKTEMLDV
ncbi:MAG: hypothetical protein PVG23_00440 [Nitrosopumilaceae archaeon]|jgi:hypothetical protein